jgi:hypothetical protein
MRPMPAHQPLDTTPSNGFVLRPVDVEAFLIDAGAPQFEHANGRNLHDHLIGTREILRRWLQPRWVQDAGVVHSVYSNEVYRKQLIPLTQRDRVRGVVGERAEALAYLFCVLSRRSLFAAIEARVRSVGDGLLVKRTDSSEVKWVNPCDAAHLLLLHMANHAEQARGRSGEPGRWLAQVSRMGAALDASAVVLPQCFASFTRIVSAHDEDRAREAYLAGLRMADDSAAAAQFAVAVEACPWPAEPSVALAYRALRSGDLDAARSSIAHAQRALIELGTAWDPRLQYDEWSRLISLIQEMTGRPGAAGARLPDFDLNQVDLVMAISEAAFKVRRADRAARDMVHGLYPERFRRYIASLADGQPSARMNHYPDLSSTPWHDPSRFSLVTELEANFANIRAELTALRGEGFHRESERIPRRGSWDVFMLYERGRKRIENCDRCPITTGIIEAHNTVRTHVGLIYFSRMSPGTHIAAHHGPTNLRLRCHLGIEVPAGDCAIRVDTETRIWREGECMVFDDYFEHEAWNHTAQQRSVLIVDLWHPDLTTEEIKLLAGLHRYSFAMTRSLNRYWAANERSRRGWD